MAEAPESSVSTESEPMLLARGLVRTFEERRAVDGLDLEAFGGEILGLVGPNGAGKTTTLRCLSGVLPPTSGELRVAGYDLARAELEAKRRLAYVQDEPAPFEVLTVDEHLEFTARLYGLDGDWPARADALLERFELKERRDALGSELSRGMRQKLSFCCAWLPEPAVILLDEPLSGLDPRGIRAARAAILEERERGAAVVLSSHLLELVQSLADRILILDGGRRVFVGTLEEARAAVAAGEGDTLEDVFFAATGEASAEDDAASGDRDA
ncbi:MAG: ABC transporter ATP-binding protein [Planctomycetota bacterium]